MIYYGLLLFFFLEYVRPGSYIPGLNLLRLNSLVPVAVIVGTVFSRVAVPNHEVFAQSNTKMILCLLGLLGISVMTADVTLYAYTLFTQVLGYFLVYWVIARQITDIRRIKGLFKTLVFVHVVMAALTPQMFTDPDTRHYLASGTFLGDGNDFALSVDIVIPFALFLMFDAPKGRQKLFWGVVLGFLVLCVVATQSRGGTLALAAMGAYYWWKSNRKAVTAALAVVAVAVVLMAAPPKYFERMNTISSYETDGSAQGRLTAWRAGIGMMLSNPILGVGGGQFPANYVTYAPNGPAGAETRWRTAHSIYFLILGELGLPGIALLIGFIVSNLTGNRRILKALRESGRGDSTAALLMASLSASMLAYAVAGAFLSATYYPHMFVIGGLSVAGRRIALLTGKAAPAAVSVAAKPAVTYHWAMRRTAPRRAS